jgi:hypothetical protein
MATASTTLNNHGLIVVPRCAEPGWVAEHGNPTVEYEPVKYIFQKKFQLMFNVALLLSMASMESAGPRGLTRRT